MDTLFAPLKTPIRRQDSNTSILSGRTSVRSNKGGKRRDLTTKGSSRKLTFAPANKS